MKIDALGIMATVKAIAPLQGIPEPAARLRARIGSVDAVLRAGAASKESDTAFRAGCTRMLADVEDMRRAWVSAFGFDWETGEALPMWRRPRTPLVPLLQSAYVSEDQLRFNKPWMNAAAVALRAERTAELAAIPKPTAAQVEAARKERDRAERERGRAAADARRQEEELVSFRVGTLRRVKFPSERPARARTMSRWG